MADNEERRKTLALLIPERPKMDYSLLESDKHRTINHVIDVLMYLLSISLLSSNIYAIIAKF